MKATPCAAHAIAILRFGFVAIGNKRIRAESTYIHVEKNENVAIVLVKYFTRLIEIKLLLFVIFLSWKVGKLDREPKYFMYKN